MIWDFYYKRRIASVELFDIVNISDTYLWTRCDVHFRIGFWFWIFNYSYIHIYHLDMRQLFYIKCVKSVESNIFNRIYYVCKFVYNYCINFKVMVGFYSLTVSRLKLFAFISLQLVKPILIVRLICDTVLLFLSLLFLRSDVIYYLSPFTNVFYQKCM